MNVIVIPRSIIDSICSSRRASYMIFSDIWLMETQQ